VQQALKDATALSALTNFINWSKLKMRKEVWTCDECSVETSQPNGWVGVNSKIGTWLINDWDHVGKTDSHCCGLPCAFRKISRLNTAI
jgi:hypothetical protein